MRTSSENTRGLVLLDRDGVINQDSASFIKTPDEWQPIPGSLDAIARLSDAGYQVVVMSNQSGVGRGLFSIYKLHAIHRKMLAAIREVGGQLAGIAFCAHAPKDFCLCRKPRSGLIIQLLERMPEPILLSIGDSPRDLLAARGFTERLMLVRTGKGQAAEARCQALIPEVRVYADLAAAVEAFFNEHEASREVTG